MTDDEPLSWVLCSSREGRPPKAVGESLAGTGFACACDRDLTADALGLGSSLCRQKTFRPRNWGRNSPTSGAHAHALPHLHGILADPSASGPFKARVNVPLAATMHALVAIFIYYPNFCSSLLLQRYLRRGNMNVPPERVSRCTRGCIPITSYSTWARLRQREQTS